ncbi:uncharacterized protein [Diadema antillarum]|uniref:uncharacterized protein n=1 Tax=Diadema antillarum TaxID=105358 RepID=UPI003A858B7C
MQLLLAIALFATLLAQSSPASVHYASCLLAKSGNTQIVGRVDLREQSGTLEINLQVDGSKLSLQADSKHGFHVHTYGNIRGSCGSTGGHYNPDDVNHAGPTDSERHVGDLGNVVTNSSGDIDVRFNDTFASLVGNKSIIGRSFVLHAGEDDLGKVDNDGSRASGNAGARLACCVIGWASGSEWTDS